MQCLCSKRAKTERFQNLLQVSTQTPVKKGKEGKGKDGNDPGRMGNVGRKRREERTAYMERR